ncbi:MAG: hypothetical protein AABX16_02230 [Nanoarchaeota archaeon]
MIAQFLGFILIAVGFIFSGFNTFFCQKLCLNCLQNNSQPCQFLFLFVAIIFIVCGTILVINKENR